LGEFDRASAIMRLLLVLSTGPKNMKDACDALYGGFGVDRTAANSSVKAALRLGLVRQERRGKSLMTGLTIDGQAVAIRVRDIQAVLDEKSEYMARRGVDVAGQPV
jgi:hypothetical protein